MSKLPSGWTTSTLIDAGIWGSGGTPNKSNQDYYENGTIPWLIIGDLNDDYVHGAKTKITAKGLHNSSAKLIPIGTLLIAMYGSIGKLGITEIECATNQAIASCQVNEDIFYKKFLFYLLLASREKLFLLGKGGAQQNISQTVLKEFPVEIAPLNEQIRIANKLDSVLAKVDAAQARLEKIPTLLKRFRQSVLAAATSGELTREWREKNIEASSSSDICDGQFLLIEDTLKIYDIPETWRWVALGNYAKCNRGKFSIRPRNDPSCFEGQYPFIQIGDLPKDGGLVSAHNQSLNEKGFSVSKIFDAGTVVIAIVGATIANTGILKYPMCFPDSLVGINSASATGNIYVDYYLRANKENIRQASYAGGGQPNIKLTVLNPLPFPLPPAEEQKEIVRRVESLFALADTVEKQYLAAKQRTDRLTQSLLAKAFRGELVPQDPNDEPAADLLKRIQAERNTQPPAKNKRSKPA